MWLKALSGADDDGYYAVFCVNEKLPVESENEFIFDDLKFSFSTICRIREES